MSVASPAAEAAEPQQEPLPLRMRPDLVVRTEVYEGRTCYIIKDPIGLRYFRFDREEHRLLSLLNGQRTPDQIVERMNADFRPQQFQLADVTQFAQQLLQLGLVVTTVPGVGDALYEAREKRKRQRLISTFTNFLYIKLPGFDPERLLSWMYPRVAFLFSTTGVALTVLLWLAAALLVTLNYDQFRSRPELLQFHTFFNVHNVIWLWVAVGISKILHEFGHGLTCKHFKGECHDMGVLFLVFTPCLYCNVSDSWMTGSRWARIWISAAGMYVEITLASIAVFAWWLTEPGIIHNIAFAMMAVCSFNTLLVNGNPLLRYDGYYVMTDLLHVPNLMQKSSELVRHLIFRHALGIDIPAPAFLPERRRWLFVTYAVLAWLYRLVLVVVISWFLYRFLEPYKLGVISKILGAAGLGLTVVMPLWKTVSFVAHQDNVGEIVTGPKFIRTIVILTIAVAAFGWLPIPHRVESVASVEYRDAVPVYATVAGYLKEIRVVPGQRVKKGDVIAVFDNEPLEEEIAELEHRLRLVDIRIQTAIALEREHDRQALEVSARQTREMLETRKQQLAELTVTAPRRGIVIPAAARPANAGVKTSEISATHPLKPENLDRYLNRNTLLCEIGPSRDFDAVLLIDQSEMEFVDHDQQVWLKLDVAPDVTLTGTTESVGIDRATSVPTPLSNRVGGELATISDDGISDTPVSPHYQVRVRIDDSDQVDVGNVLRHGNRGKARVNCGTWTCWQWLARTFNQIFQI
ncbi:MAG: biotin/lipoyl-binding protein [Maioricimonas sp. JB049]